LSFPRGRDLGSFIVFWSSAVFMWGVLIAIVVWVVVARL
jgi:hypothetical protein